MYLAQGIPMIAATIRLSILLWVRRTPFVRQRGNCHFDILSRIGYAAHGGVRWCIQLNPTNRGDSSFPTTETKLCSPNSGLHESIYRGPALWVAVPPGRICVDSL